MIDAACGLRILVQILTTVTSSFPDTVSGPARVAKSSPEIYGLSKDQDGVTPSKMIYWRCRIAMSGTLSCSGKSKSFPARISPPFQHTLRSLVKAENPRCINCLLLSRLVINLDSHDRGLAGRRSEAWGFGGGLDRGEESYGGSCSSSEKRRDKPGF